MAEQASIPNAEQLRMRLLEEQMKEMERQEKARAAAQKELAAFTDDFLKHHISDDERAMIRRLVKNAVEKGQMEALVYSFPSDLCTDGGRAINNADPNWPETLQGKAKEMYDAFKARIQPRGLQAQGDDHQLSRRDSRRRRLLPELGAAGKGVSDARGPADLAGPRAASGSPGHVHWTSGTTLRGAVSAS